MKTRLGLGQVDQVLRHTFFAEGAPDHIFVSSGAGQGALDGAAPTVGEVIDVAGDLVGHHQGQVGVGRLDLSLRLGLDVKINRRCDLVRFVDWSGLGFLLGETIALLQGRKLQTVNSVQNAVEFVLQVIVGFKIKPAAQQLVEGGVEVLL